MLFQDAAIDSARRYYQYLEESGGGLIKTGVVRIDMDVEFFVLHLKSRLAFSDDAFVRINNKDYTREQMLPVEYDEMRRTLRIRPKAEYRDELAFSHPHDIVVVSDLKFLVKRVEEWYKIHGDRPQIPCRKPDVIRHTFPDLKHQPSDDQEAAIEGVLSSPFSYVWGAPGTGKTRFVLARCILNYILTGKKVLITAPTNNAVEQMLYGVLAVLEEAGIAVDHVLRLGLASSEFVSRYPSVCVDAAHAKRISALAEQVKADLRLMEETDKLLAMLPERALFKAKSARFQECSSLLLHLFDELNALRCQEDELEDTTVVLAAERSLMDEQIKKLKAEHGRVVDSVRKLTLVVEKYSHGLRKLLWKKKHEQYLTELEHAVADEKRIQREIDDQSQKLHSLHNEEQRHTDSVKRKRAETAHCREKIEKLTEFWSELHTVALKAMKRADMSADYPQMTELLQTVAGKIHRREQTYQALENTSEQDLLARKEKLTRELEEHQKKLEEAEAQSTSARIQKATVLAATVDRCIKDLPPDGDFQPEHVFLDEAGYCALVKAVTLMGYDCPLTFLGDHMQLPPVCEMNNDKMQGINASVALWAQSALYADDALTLEPKQVYADYFNHTPAHFQDMRKFNLIHTYRFGESLAHVLESEVYTEGFSGSVNHDTEIYYLPIHRISDEKKRTSSEECRVITEYCQSTSEHSIGIITPYTAQRDLLRKALSFNSLFSDAVMTVHGSQGREWDVVLFSIVDTNDKWFTNSRNSASNGRHVINTAVSRAKKKLILVCDADYWQTQNQQLIGKLLAVATEI